MSAQRNSLERELILRPFMHEIICFYNSSRKPAYASARCSGLLVIREMEYDC